MATITRTADRDREQLRRSAMGRDQGPTAEQQTGAVNLYHPRAGVVSELGDPQDPTNVSFPFLRRMRRDHMVAMGLHFIAMPILKAPWYIEADDARVAAFVDNLIRPIYGKLLLTILRFLWAGYSPAVKNFDVVNPAWSYIPGIGQDPKRVWDDPAVGALIYKPVIQLRPENALPVWDASGNFNGITYDSRYGGVGYFLINGQRKADIDLTHAVWATHDAEGEDGCQPPGERVLTTQGYVAIEDLEPEKHRLVSYNPSQSKIHRGYEGLRRRRSDREYQSGGYSFEVFTRPHRGDMLQIVTDAGSMKCTPNHKLTVRWAEHARSQWCVYLMRRGDDWRIGTTRIINEKKKQTNSGVGARMQRERAGEGWILGAYEDRADALFHEALWAQQYGVPDSCFVSTPTDSGLQQEHLDEFWRAVDSASGAYRLLADRKLERAFPLYCREDGKQGARQAGRVQFMVHAANLLPGSMEIPTDPGDGMRPVWREFVVDCTQYDGVVYSLQVDPYEHYVSGGVITRNSAFGFPRIAHCAPIFHMYRYIWTLLGRAFENNADPGPVVRFPSEDPLSVDREGKRETNAQKGLRIGKRKRSGSTIALPSDQWVDITDKPTGKFKWDIEYPKPETEFGDIMNFLDFLESSKLRCVTADTPIDCPRDHERYPDGIPISQLREGQLIWCFNEVTEVFELRPLKKVLPTRPNAEILKLTLDTGKVIRATPDHRFLKRDGTWEELRHLQPGDSLMPLERDFEPFVKIKPNERGWQRNGSGSREYDLVARAVLGERDKGDHTHHVDERHCNTEPENLIYLKPSEHTVLTNQGQRRPPGHHGRVLAGMAERKCEDCGDIFAPRGPTSKRCDTCQALARFAQLSKPKPGAKSKDMPPRDCQGCSRSYIPTSNAQKWCPSCRAQRWLEKSKASPVTREEWLAGLPNHKVATIEPASCEDTWDLSVDGPPECHNFVAHGVVLHNSLWLQEQGLIEGSGSTSNRNVASEFGDQRDSSQAVLMQQIDELILDMFVKPALAMNMPWFEGKVEKKNLGFGSDDEDVVRQVIQLAGQVQGGQGSGLFRVDVNRLLEARGLPMLSDQDWTKVSRQFQTQAAREASAPSSRPTVEPVQGRRALVTQTGFSDESMYVQVELDPIELSTDGDFVANLPRTPMFEDTRVVSATRDLRKTASGFLAWAYADFARYIGKQRTLKLSELLDEVAREQLSIDGEELDEDGRVRKAVDRLIAGWKPRPERVSEFAKKSQGALSRVFDRTTSLHLSRLRSRKKLSSLDRDAAAWLDDRGAQMVTSVLDTTRQQLAEVLADGIRASKTTGQIAGDIREKFDGFPISRAATIARTEIGEAYNYATASAGIAAGVKRAQLIDGNQDEPCKKRNGRIVSLTDALRERLNHPNCTFCLRLLPRASDSFSIRFEQLDGRRACYDEDTETVLFDAVVIGDDEFISSYLLAMGDVLAQIDEEQVEDEDHEEALVG